MFRRVVSKLQEINLKRFLYLMHVCGFLSLPQCYQYHKIPWKSELHRYFTYSNLTLQGISLFFISLNLFINTTQDLSLFCTSFFLWDIAIAEFGLVCLFNAKVKTFLEYLNFCETFTNHHSEHRTVSQLRKIERTLLLVGLVLVSVCMMFDILLFPFLPKSNQVLETLANLYNVKYPQNTMALQWYFPWVDLSQPKIFFLYFILYFHLCCIQILGFVLVIGSYPICVFHLKTQYIILRDFTLRLGQTHYNSKGKTIFHVNLMRNETVVRELKMKTDGQKQQEPEPEISERDKHLSRLFQQNPVLYEKFYLGQIIHFHQRLISQRKLLDNYFRTVFTFFAFVLVLILPNTMYGIFTPILPTNLERWKMIAEAGGSLAIVFVYFYCGELLAGCNQSLASGIWLSRWYTCSTRTQHDMVMFLKMNQKLQYFKINHWDFGYKWMLGAVKFSYSVFNMMRIRNARK
uniref:Odorant receptor n=1 Tax=Cacopsylla melanoneura TaxID=428564 RepID=A0A8D9BC42_9HEMI